MRSSRIVKPQEVAVRGQVMIMIASSAAAAGAFSKRCMKTGRLDGVNRDHYER
jgi:hypothetical protein